MSACARAMRGTIASGMSAAPAGSKGTASSSASAAARGDLGLAGRRLDEAERGWRRLASAGPSGDAFAAALVDLGRPPVAGLVVPDQELALLAADRAALARAGQGVA